MNISVDLSAIGAKSIEIERRHLLVGAKLPYDGDVCDFYECTHTTPRGAPKKKGWTWVDRLVADEEVSTEAVLKVARNEVDNDLVENEIKTVTALFPSTAADEKFYRYFVRPLEEFTLRGGRTSHRAIVLTKAQGYVPLTEVLRAFPNGLDFRDVAWMFKRILAGVGFAHEKGIVHAAIVPAHILIHPDNHGAKIIGWSYAVPSDTRVKAISLPNRAFYPEEVFNKEVHPSTDIYMVGKCVIGLLGGNISTNEMPSEVPEEVRRLILECVAEQPTMRPSDAWDLHEEWDDLLKKIVGPRNFRPFKMPEPA